MKTPYNITILGAGQLGSRHLQSLGGLAIPANLFVYDISHESLERARSLYEVGTDNDFIQSVTYTTDLDDLPRVIDFMIVSTGSRGRSELIEDVMAGRKIRNMLLEKVLFQTVEEYDRIGSLLHKNGVRAWVNCPRRLYGVYQQIRQHTLKAGPTYGIYENSNWGMACNSIHFIDIFCYLTGEGVATVDASGLDKNVWDSKREGYIEFSGNLTVHMTGGSVLMLTDRRQTISNKGLMYISGANVKAVIDESEKSLRFCTAESGWSWEEAQFTIPYQSELTKSVATDILIHGRTELTSYKESTGLHTPLIQAFLLFLSDLYNEQVTTCPIT